MKESKNSSLVEKAYKIIKNKICDFELYPGQPISDHILSKELAMSRTPIRSALQKIYDEGLVEINPQGKGYVVTEITDEKIIEVFDARECIEVAALSLAMDRGIQPSDIEALNNINNIMEDYNRTDKLRFQFEYDQKFHDFLVALSGNTKLIKFHSSLFAELTRMRLLSYLERSYQQKAYNDHSNIIKYIAENNKEAAVEALRNHIRTSKRDYRDLINNKISLDAYGMLRFLMQTTQ